MKADIFPQINSINASEILAATKAQRMLWEQVVLKGSHFTKVWTGFYRGWQCTIEDGFLWAASEGTLIPLGSEEVYEILLLIE